MLTLELNNSRGMNGTFTVGVGSVTDKQGEKVKMICMVMD